MYWNLAYQIKNGYYWVILSLSYKKISHLVTNSCLDLFSPIYENFVLLGDFNMTTANPNKKNFVGSFDLHGLTGSPTCYKSINLIYIDLVLTNKKKRFMKSATFETNNNLTTTILRKTISKCNSKKNSTNIVRDLTKRHLKLS